MSKLTPDRTAEPVSRDQILRRERGQGNIHFSCSADHVQDWQPYPLDPYPCNMCDNTLATVYKMTIHTLVILCHSVCVCVFIELHITAQSGPVILVILCHSH